MIIKLRYQKTTIMKKADDIPQYIFLQQKLRELHLLKQEIEMKREKLRRNKTTVKQYLQTNYLQIFQEQILKHPLSVGVC